MKRFTYLFVLLILLSLMLSPAVQAQDGITVTVPPGSDTIPPVTWNPDNWILIITVGFVIALGTLGGVVVFFGNKLYNSAPAWAQPGIENVVRSGVDDALEAGQTIVIKTPTPLDDYALEIVRQGVQDMMKKLFEAKG